MSDDPRTRYSLTTGGNVRGWENCIERCCAMEFRPVIHTSDLPSSITRSPTQHVQRRAGEQSHP